jgi:hypothetical protein
MNKDLTIKQYHRDILRWSLTAFVGLACVVAILISLAINTDITVGTIALRVLNVICSFCFGSSVAQIVTLAVDLHKYKKRKAEQ